MNAPLVSIIVATYRRDAALHLALESLAVQTYPQIEIVLVDDNADADWNAKVRAVIDAFRAAHPGIALQAVFNRENQGSAMARNIGIDAACGEYVTFLDDDDVYLPDKIRHQAEATLSANADFSLTDLDLYHENNQLAERRTRDYLAQTDPSDLLKYHLMHHMTGTDTMMFRKAYLLEIGKFPLIDLGDEFYLMMESIAGGGKFLYVPGCHVCAYVHKEGGLSSGEQKIVGENALYQYKQTFFDRIDARSRRHIRMRHYAVLAFAGLRMKKPLYVLKNGAASFLAAPLACFKLFFTRKIKA